MKFCISNITVVVESKHLLKNSQLVWRVSKTESRRGGVGGGGGICITLSKSVE